MPQQKGELMSDPGAVFQGAVCKLLGEIFDGPPGDEAYILNPGDPGLLRQLESISAAAASRRPAPGRPAIAAHADHVLFGLTLLNRWIAGEENPWAGARWDASWQIGALTDDQWRDLLARLRQAAGAWKNSAATFEKWDPVSAAGAISSVAHTAYHLGAIRQILRMVRERSS
jgi:hypothetical protein